jgi:hypothetical protein
MNVGAGWKRTQYSKARRIQAWTCDVCNTKRVDLSKLFYHQHVNPRCTGNHACSAPLYDHIQGNDAVLMKNLLFKLL